MCPFVSMMCESRDVRRYVGSFLSEEEKKMLRLTCRGVGRALLKDMLEEYMWRVQSEKQLREWSEEWRARVRRVYWDSEQPLPQEQDLLARLTHLTFGRDFNRSVDSLPQGLTHLTFGRYFNQSVDSLPQGLSHLRLGTGIAKHSAQKLPASLTLIKVGQRAFRSVRELIKAMSG